jgi:hypothetical protein
MLLVFRLNRAKDKLELLCSQAIEVACVQGTVAGHPLRRMSLHQPVMEAIVERRGKSTRPVDPFAASGKKSKEARGDVHLASDAKNGFSSFSQATRQQSPRASVNQSQALLLELVDDLSAAFRTNGEIKCNATNRVMLESAPRSQLKALVRVPAKVAAAVPAAILEEVFEGLGGRVVPAATDGRGEVGRGSSSSCGGSEGQYDLTCTLDPFLLDVAEELTRARVIRMLSSIAFDANR